MAKERGIFGGLSCFLAENSISSGLRVELRFFLSHLTSGFVLYIAVVRLV